jgi:hypothetical protein
MTPVVGRGAKSSSRIAARVAGAHCQGTIGGGPTYVERASEGTMSPSEIRACYRLYAAHRRSHRPALDHLRKVLASFAAQLFGRGALAAR